MKKPEGGAYNGHGHTGIAAMVLGVSPVKTQQRKRLDPSSKMESSQFPL